MRAVADRQPAKYGHSQLSSLVIQHVDNRPLAGFGLSRPDELAHRDPLQAIKASSPPQLGQRRVDLADEGSRLVSC
jgi:hypothetical protein